MTVDGEFAGEERHAVGLHLGPVPADPEGMAYRAAERSLGSGVGIIGKCEPIDSARVPGLAAYVAHGPKRIPGWHFPEPANGTGLSTRPYIARLAAIGEAVEAYTFYAPADGARLVRAPYSALEGVAVAPHRFAWPSPSQYRRLHRHGPLGAHESVDWCWAWSLTDGCPKLVPSALVHLDSARQPPNDFLPELTSTGMACHVSLHHAVLAGLCEILERDALAVTWYNGLSVTRLVTNGTSVEPLITTLSAGDLCFDVFQVPSDAPFPVVLSLAGGGGGGVHAAVGAACRPEPEAAAIKAITESCQVLLRLESSPQGGDDDDAAARYASTEGAALLARCLNTAQRVELLAEVRTIGVGDTARDLRRGVRALADVGLEVLVAELTTADVAATGYRVVRVLVPGALTTGTAARYAPLGAARLYQLPVDLGLQSSPLAETELRDLPVPLA